MQYDVILVRNVRWFLFLFALVPMFSSCSIIIRTTSGTLRVPSTRIYMHTFYEYASVSESESSDFQQQSMASPAAVYL